MVIDSDQSEFENNFSSSHKKNSSSSKKSNKKFNKYESDEAVDENDNYEINSFIDDKDVIDNIC